MSAHILIVDDEVTLPLFLQRYLCATRPGDLIETVTTAAAALNRLERHHYDLVIVDHILPDASGFSVLTRARRQKPPAQGILMTGYSSAALVHAAHEAGVTWLAKPFELRTMLRLVNERLGPPTVVDSVEAVVTPIAAD
jgi:DNA-binding NtrC family response regulator